MGCLLGVLRWIAFCEQDDDELVDGSNARRSRSSDHGGYYYRARDSQVRSPTPSERSTARPTQAYSLPPSTLATASPHHPTKPLPPSPSPPPRSTFAAAIPPPSKWPYTVIAAASSDPVKRQPPVNPSIPSSRDPPSSPLSSNVSTASPLPSKAPSIVATPALQPIKLQLPSSKASPSSSSLSSKVSAVGPPPSQPPKGPVFTFLFDVDSLRMTPKNACESSLKSSSPLSSNVSSPASPPLSKASPFSPSSQPPESGRRTPETPGVEQKEKPDRYDIPEHLQEMIKKDIVPPVLKMPLSPKNYAEYFSTLLFAEDYEIEKWSEYLLTEVTLKLWAKADFFNSRYPGQARRTQKNQNDEYPFVAFEVDAVPERRPYLLSRDYVFVQPSGEKKTEPFKGVIFRVVKSTKVLVEFGRDFHKQHSPTKKYDVSFSFNRVCLKRSHAAVSAATDPLLCKILFPNPGLGTTSSSLMREASLSIRGSTKYDHVIKRILDLEGLVPYLIEGPLVVNRDGVLGVTGKIIHEAIFQIYSTCYSCKILVCAPKNRTCDALMRSLFNIIPKTKLFRANAAFREQNIVPEDIMPTCFSEGECFTCPPLAELQRFDIVASTFMSSFRLHNAGIEANHFTHIFLVDASSAMEPETTVALANLVSAKAVIVVTGSSGDCPLWVRSGIARRKNGLRRSLFHRLMEQVPYSWNDPMYATHIRDEVI